MTLKKVYHLVAPLCLILTISVLTLGAKSNDAKTPEQQLVEEIKRTNQLLEEMNNTLHSFQAKDAVLSKMNKTLTTIQKDLNNSKNNICIKEHLEDIKDLLDD